MALRREGGNLARIALLIFTFLLWVSGLVLICIGIWMLVDPKRSYILELVNFSEDDPLLVFAAYTSIFTGIGTLFIGFLSCCGAMRRMRCMLGSLMVAMVVLFLCGIGIGTLALVYRDKFPDDRRMTRYIANMTHNRYYRDKWVMPLLDTIQFYAQTTTVTNTLRFMMRHEYGVLAHLKRNNRVTQLIDKLQFNLECCGVASHRDWRATDWAMDGNGKEDSGRALWLEHPNEYVAVPSTCCRQQQCCGGETPRDYHMSFWYITNTERGTRSFVPTSCCRQTQTARAWHIAPIDPMCTIYHYDTTAFKDAVYQEGCGPKLHRWFSEQTTIFAVVGFTFAALQIIGIVLALCMCNQVRYYHYVRDEVY